MFGMFFLCDRELSKIIFWRLEFGISRINKSNSVDSNSSEWAFSVVLTLVPVLNKLLIRYIYFAGYLILVLLYQGLESEPLTMSSLLKTVANVYLSLLLY